MTSIADWTTETERARRDDGDPSRHGARGASLGGLVRQLTGFVRRTAARRLRAAPPAPRSLIYVLCEEYRRFDLWSAYYAFRVDPRARTWKRLRRRHVPWQHEQTVEMLVHRLCPRTDKRTPDAAAVGLALVTTPPHSMAQPRKRR